MTSKFLIAAKCGWCKAFFEPNEDDLSVSPEVEVLYCSKFCSDSLRRSSYQKKYRESKKLPQVYIFWRKARNGGFDKTQPPAYIGGSINVKNRLDAIKHGRSHLGAVPWLKEYPEIEVLPYSSVAKMRIAELDWIDRLGPLYNSYGIRL